MVNVCKYCGKELSKWEMRNHGRVCGRCGHKSQLLHRYVKARDDLRERLGLQRMCGEYNG